MSKHNKTTLDAKRLYSAIGQIDDRFAEEAMEYRAEPKKSARILPFLPMAASFVAALLALTVAVRIFAGPLPPAGGAGTESHAGTAPHGSDSPAGNDGLPVLWSVTDGYLKNTALLSCLAESRDSAVKTESAPCVKGDRIKIIWRDESDGTYYTVSLDALTSDMESRLNALIDASNAAAKVEPNSDAVPFSLWIVTGDGTAVSPYLSRSSGNISYLTLGEYVPEQLPSEAFAAFLIELIESNLP